MPPITVIPGAAAAAAAGSEAYDIEQDDASFTAGSMSAEFDGSLSPWALGGSTVSGTADPIVVPTSPIADLTTRSGSVLLQPYEGATAQIYAALSLADGEEMIISMSAPYPQGGGGNNDTAYGISLNTSTTGYDAGTFDWFYWDGGNDAIDHWNGSSVVHFMGTKLHPGSRFYWRLVRTGDDIIAFFSMTGDVWCAFSEVDTVTRGHTHIWIFYRVAALGFSKMVAPMEVRWARHKSYDGAFPW